jgi:hypothetical protein
MAWENLVVKIVAPYWALYRRKPLHFVSFPPDIVPETYKDRAIFSCAVRKSTWSLPTTVYIDRLETVSFSVFTFVRETWSTRAAVIKNTEA